MLESSPEYKKGRHKETDPVDKSRSKWDKVYWVEDTLLLEKCSWDIEEYQKKDGVIIYTEPVELKENKPEAIKVDDREVLILSDVYEMVDGERDLVAEEKVALKRLYKRKPITTRQKSLVVEAFSRLRKLLTLYGVGRNNKVKTRDIPVVLETLTSVERKLWGVE